MELKTDKKDIISDLVQMAKVNDRQILSLEDYIESRWLEGPGATFLDDDLPDAFETYLVELDVHDWLLYGDEYRDYVELKVYENNRRR